MVLVYKWVFPPNLHTSKSQQALAKNKLQQSKDKVHKSFSEGFGRGPTTISCYPRLPSSTSHTTTPTPPFFDSPKDPQPYRSKRSNAPRPRAKPDFRFCQFCGASLSFGRGTQRDVSLQSSGRRLASEMRPTGRGKNAAPQAATRVLFRRCSEDAPISKMFRRSSLDFDGVPKMFQRYSWYSLYLLYSQSSSPSPQTFRHIDEDTYDIRTISLMEQQTTQFWVG